MTTTTARRELHTLTNPTHGPLHPDEHALAERLGAFMATRATDYRTGRMVVSVWITGRRRADRAAAFLADHGHLFAGPIVTTDYEEPRTICRLDLEPAAELLEAGDLRQCDGCGRLEDAGTQPDQDGAGRSACCAPELEEVGR